MRWPGLRIALAISIALNLFALGAAGGALAVWSHARQRSPAGRARPVMAAADALPPADAARYRALMRATVVQNRPLIRTARQNRYDAAMLFVQPGFDAAASAAALSRARDADFELRTRLETAVIGFAKDLPQAERAAFVQSLARGGPLRHPSAAPGRSAGEPAPSMRQAPPAGRH